MIVNIAKNVSKTASVLLKINVPNVLTDIQCLKGNALYVLKLLEHSMDNAQVAALELKELFFLVLIVYQLQIVIHFYLLEGVFLVKVALKSIAMAFV